MHEPRREIVRSVFSVFLGILARYWRANTGVDNRAVLTRQYRYSFLRKSGKPAISSGTIIRANRESDETLTSLLCLSSAADLPPPRREGYVYRILLHTYVATNSGAINGAGQSSDVSNVCNIPRGIKQGESGSRKRKRGKDRYHLQLLLSIVFTLLVRILSNFIIKVAHF